MSGQDWSDEENDAIVADYFAMLIDDISGRPYNKAAHNRVLQDLIGRSRGSIEFKHSNISAAIKGFGLPLLSGYQPRYNFQMSLAEAISRWLARHPDWLTTPRPPETAFAEAAPLFVGIAPTLRNAPPPIEAEQLHAVARRFDIAGRDERNRSLGKAGEERALHHERANLRQAGREDLARRVRWVSEEDGDGAGYDIHSFTPEGKDRLIEVKTTNGWERTPFYISSNEIDVANARQGDWRLFRLWDFVRAPKAFELHPPLERYVELTATSFRASFH
ncbi:DUF3883 domain-containing protein [Sedimentimonas flavescens]|uniref:DUF3883 domain-containing protein n=1 Tax=Sedimentimonas flavescens TaxID=2851012 RepID=A0ABT3A1M8_9RHOB|nr:DUF3883 domain-containing protein [Sedimentimonas flavescens]MCV2879907.1 DUF3883 domain-containing protein [Sedimentimonas flavescens]